MRILGAREAQADLAGLLDTVCTDKQAVTLERDGIPVAALVPMETLQRLADLDSALSCGADTDLGGGNTVRPGREGRCF